MKNIFWWIVSFISALIMIVVSDYIIALLGSTILTYVKFIFPFVFILALIPLTYFLTQKSLLVAINFDYQKSPSIAVAILSIISIIYGFLIGENWTNFPAWANNTIGIVVLVASLGSIYIVMGSRFTFELNHKRKIKRLEDMRPRIQD